MNWIDGIIRYSGAAIVGLVIGLLVYWAKQTFEKRRDRLKRQRDESKLD